MANARTTSILLTLLCVLAPLELARAAGPLDSQRLYGTVQKELGGLRGSYFVQNLLVSEQIVLGMGNPAPNVRLADGNYLASGCRQHECPEKSAVIVTPSGTMLAAALIYFPCIEHSKDLADAGSNCAQHRILALFVKQKNNRPALLKELQDWAEGEVGAERKEYGASLVGYITKTETRIIP